MANVFDDSAFRAGIHVAMASAWTAGNAPTRIYDDRPRTVLAAANLPIGVIDLMRADQPEESPYSSWQKTEQRFQYELWGIWSMPASGNVYVERQARANELVALLTASVSFAGSTRRHVTAYVPSDAEVDFVDPAEPIYAIKLAFVVYGSGNY